MRVTIWLLVLLTAASTAEAATITVRRDGTGDYLTIQPAFDAAADGDTVSIGPGEYTESSTVPGLDFLVYGRISQSRLTVIGAGAEATVIGPTMFAPDFQRGSPEGFSTPGIQSQIAMRDLTIRNCYNGLAMNGSLQLENCRFDGNNNALALLSSATDNFITDCRVQGATAVLATAMALSGGGSYAIDGCEFVQAYPYIGGASAVFTDCVSRGPSRTGMIVGAGHCVLRKFSIYDVETGIMTAGIGPVSSIEVHESSIAGSSLAAHIGPEGSATLQSTVLQGGSHSVIWAHAANAIVANGCDLIKGTGVVVSGLRYCSLGPVVYDLTNNYWGTTDEAQIQQWIVDVNDDPTICATVQYSPFAGQSVPIEAMSWGGLKALWR